MEKTFEDDLDNYDLLYPEKCNIIWKDEAMRKFDKYMYMTKFSPKTLIRQRFIVDEDDTINFFLDNFNIDVSPWMSERKYLRDLASMMNSTEMIIVPKNFEELLFYDLTVLKRLSVIINSDISIVLYLLLTIDGKRITFQRLYVKYNQFPLEPIKYSNSVFGVEEISKLVETGETEFKIVVTSHDQKIKGREKIRKLYLVEGNFIPPNIEELTSFNQLKINKFPKSLRIINISEMLPFNIMGLNEGLTRLIASSTAIDTRRYVLPKSLKMIVCFSLIMAPREGRDCKGLLYLNANIVYGKIPTSLRYLKCKRYNSDLPPNLRVFHCNNILKTSLRHMKNMKLLIVNKLGISLDELPPNLEGYINFEEDDPKIPKGVKYIQVKSKYIDLKKVIFAKLGRTINEYIIDGEDVGIDSIVKQRYDRLFIEGF